MEAFSIPTLLGVAISAALLALPGAALFSIVQALSKQVQKPALALLYSVGLSVAFWPLLLLYTSLLGLRFTPLLLWLVLAASLVALAALWLRPHVMWPRTRASLFATVALAGLGLADLVMRLRDIQGLAVPLFGDSLHHTMITAIIASTGQVPKGYLPYVPVDTFTYHFGFHTLAASLAQLSGLAVQDAVLIMGQVLLAAAAVPTAYLFAREVFGSRYAGLLTALLTGFVSVMPAYYVNWGRYTQLAGLVLLPAALALLVRVARSVNRDSVGAWPWREFLGAAFCVAGLAVVHYRILIFYGLFGLALALGQLLLLRKTPRVLFAVWLREAAVVGVGLLGAGPWLANVASNYFPGLVRRLQTVSTEYISSYNSAENFRHYVGLVMVALGMLGTVVALVLLVKHVIGTKSSAAPNAANNTGEAQGSYLSPEAAAMVTALWSILILVSIYYPPGAIGSYTVAISLYLPLSALGGWGLAELLERLEHRVPALPGWLVPALVLVTAPLAALVLHLYYVTDKVFFNYVLPADLAAFRWINANTPQNSQFLISSEFSYAGRGVTASDAGMWLPLLAGRNVSIPALASWTEHPLDPQFFTEVRTLAAYSQPTTDPEVLRLANLGTIPAPLQPSDPKVLAAMRTLGINYVYVGATGDHSKPRLDLAAMLRDTCRYKSVYVESGVTVLQVNTAVGACK